MRRDETIYNKRTTDHLTEHAIPRDSKIEAVNGDAKSETKQSNVIKHQ